MSPLLRETVPHSKGCETLGAQHPRNHSGQGAQACPWQRPKLLPRASLRWGNLKIGLGICGEAWRGCRKGHECPWCCCQLSTAPILCPAALLEGCRAHIHLLFAHREVVPARNSGIFCPSASLSLTPPCPSSGSSPCCARSSWDSEACSCFSGSGIVIIY